MGEIANDMISGACCQLCGQYFKKNEKLFKHGFEVVCWECWEGLTKKEKKFHTKATAQTL